MRFHILLAGGVAVLCYIFVQYYILKHIVSLYHTDPHSLGDQTLWGLSIGISLFTLFCMASGAILPHIPILQKGFLLMGAIALGVQTTCLMLFLGADLLQLLLRLLPKGNRMQTFLAGFRYWSLLVMLITGIVTSYGIFNAERLSVTKYHIQIEKPMEAPLRIVLLSDQHEGTALLPSHLKRTVALANQQQPDLILLAGDLFDENSTIRQQQDAYATLSALQAPLGVYYVYGNHEHSHKENDKIRTALEAIGITVLEDSHHILANKLILVGRKDASEERMPLSTLLQGTDPTLPLLLMDHQPTQLQEAASLGVDLQVSGHTHGGQIAPGGLLSAIRNEATYGLYRNGAYHLIVSSGSGVWGVPFRTARHSEIVSITLSGSEYETASL